MIWGFITNENHMCWIATISKQCLVYIRCVSYRWSSTRCQISVHTFHTSWTAFGVIKL